MPNTPLDTHVQVTDTHTDTPCVKPIFLHANCMDDIPLVAGLIQDAMFPMMDTQYRTTERIFVMVVNRFIWEWDIYPYYRTHSILHFSQVLRVESQHMHRADARVYTILSIIPIPAPNNTTWVYISLAGGETIRLQVAHIDITIKDVGDPWQTKVKPNHENTIITSD